MHAHRITIELRRVARCKSHTLRSRTLTHGTHRAYGPLVQRPVVVLPLIDVLLIGRSRIAPGG